MTDFGKVYEENYTGMQKTHVDQAKEVLVDRKHVGANVFLKLRRRAAL